MRRRRRRRRRARARVRLLTCDVDGVLTDGRIYVDDDGREFEGVLARSTASACKLLARRRHRRRVDHRQPRAGGRASRARSSSVAHVHPGRRRQARRRGSALRASSASRPQHCAHIGDDLPDLPVLARCGFAVTVPHAPRAVRAHAHYVTRARGRRGRGARARGADPRRAGPARRRRRARRSRAAPTQLSARWIARRALARPADRVVAGAAAGRPRGAHLLARRAGAAAGAARATARRATIPTCSSSDFRAVNFDAKASRSRRSPRKRARALSGRRQRRSSTEPRSRITAAGQARVRRSPPTRGTHLGRPRERVLHAATSRATRDADDRRRHGRQDAAGPVTLTTEYLHVIPKEERAETDQPVTIEEPRGIIQARRARARQQGEDAQAQVARQRHASNRKHSPK